MSMSKALNEQSTKPAMKLMEGSSTGPTYLPIARKGNVLLGVKPWGLADGGRYGCPQTTYFVAHLRSAPENGLFADEDHGQKVVKLQPNPPNLWDAWPGIDWQSKSKARASTNIGILLRGQFNGDDDDLQATLLNQIKDGQLSKKMAAYLVKLAGPDNLILSERKITDWLEAEYAPLIVKITGSIEKVKELKALMTASIGEFGMEGEILKKVYAKTAHGDDVEDAAEEGSEAPTDEE
jgi:hypothetical protein